LCGYEVPEIILLNKVEESMQHDCSREMSMYVSTCTNYAFNAWMPVVAMVRRMFLHLVTEISDWFIEQWFYIKFCVKLGQNPSDTCAVLSEAYGG